MHLLSTFNVVQRFNLYKKEKTYDIAAVRFFCLCKKGELSLLSSNALLSDASLLTGEVAQVV